MANKQTEQGSKFENAASLVLEHSAMQREEKLVHNITSLHLCNIIMWYKVIPPRSLVTIHHHIVDPFHPFHPQKPFASDSH